MKFMSKRFRTISAVIIASLGGFQFGFNTAIISGAILFLRKNFALTIAEESAAVSVILLGALIGSCLSGIVSGRLGRRSAMLLASLLFLAGALTAACAPGLLFFHIGRIVSGLGVGLVSVVSPLYLSEISPPEKRGLYVGCNQFAVTVGILAAYGCNYLLAPAENWRLMVAFAAVPAVLFFAGLFFIPESPSWAGDKEGRSISWKALLQPSSRRILLIGFFLMIFQQITGINSVIYFAPRIFQDAGFTSAGGAILATAGVGLVNVLATLFVLWQIDRMGRRPLLLFSNGFMALSLIILGLALATHSPFIDKIAIFSLMAYIAAFAIGMGPVPALVISEMCPLQSRGHVLGLATFSNWVFNYIVVFTFLDLGKWITFAGAFYLYAIFALLALFIVWRYIPETKGKVLQENR